MLEHLDDASRELVTLDVLSEVFDERVRQERLWGQQNHPDGTGPTIPSLNRREQAQHDCDYATKQGTLTYRHILAEEFYEAMAEADPVKLRAELVQVAAVAVGWVEKIDRDLGRRDLAKKPEPLLCPECANGKAVNCVTIALDPELDDFVPCDTTKGQP